MEKSMEKSIIKKFNGNLFFIDCETTVNKFSVHNELLFIQIGAWSLKEFCSVRTYKQLKASLPEISIINTSDATDEMKQQLRQLLLDDGNQIVFFNAPFDLSHLLKWLYPEIFYPGMELFTYSKKYINCKVWDLYLLCKIIHPGYKENSLADWSLRLTGQELDKNQQKSFKKGVILTAEQKVYMKKDVEILMFLFLQLRIENYRWSNSFTGEKTTAFDIYQIYLLGLIFETIDTNLRGIKVNFSQLSELVSSSEVALNELNFKFIKITQIEPKSVKSGKSFEELLKPLIPQNIWGIWPRTQTGLIKFSFKEFESFQLKYKIKNQLLTIFTEILKTRKRILQIKKFKNSLFENRLIFFNYDLYGAVTGRITTRNYPIQGTPAAFRKTINPGNPGNIFIVADVSQEEVRILTQISRDEALMKIFRNNLDFHSYTGSLLIVKDYESFCKLKDTPQGGDLFKSVRFLAKTLNFGLLYGMGYKTLHRNLEKGGIFQNEKETYKQWSKWQEAYKGIKKYQNKMVMAYWRSKFHNSPIFTSYGKDELNYFSLTSVGGRVKRDFKLDTGNISYEKFETIKYHKTECANFPIQSTGVDILSEVWQLISQECYGFARVVMVVHDEVVIETEPQYYDRVVSIIRKIEKEVGDKYVPLVGLKFDISEPLQNWT